jgi:hypothetical protein
MKSLKMLSAKTPRASSRASSVDQVYEEPFRGSYYNGTGVSVTLTVSGLMSQPYVIVQPTKMLTLLTAG